MSEARVQPAHPEHAAGWTDERTAILKNMWLAGKTASDIMHALGGGVTRSGVIGKVHRLKLPKRGNVTAVIQSAKARARGQKGQPKVNAIVALAAARARIAPPAFDAEPFDAETDVGIDVSKRIGLLDLTNHTCRWPVGPDTGARQMFCGCHADLIASGPYCPAHIAKAEAHR